MVAWLNASVPEADYLAEQSGQTSSGTLAAKFRIRCAKQRWRAERSP